MFFLGLIAGILLASIAFVVGYLARDVPQKLLPPLERKIRGSGEVIESPSDEALAGLEIIERNDALGLDTRLDDL